MRTQTLHPGKLLVIMVALLASALFFPAAPALAAVMAAGGDHNLVINDKGTVWGWGDGGFGQTTTPPGLVGTGSSVAAGQDHSLAVKADGTVLAWGLNNYRQCQGPCIFLARPGLPHLLLLLD